MGERLRRVAKGMAAGVLHYTGARRAMCALRRTLAGGRRVNIVSYHRVVESFDHEVRRSIPGLLTSQATFRRHLEEAHAADYRFATLDEAVDVLAGRRDFGRDLFVVTFDDGYRDVVRYAAPVLKRMGIPAMLYLPTGFVGTQRRFNHDRLFHLLNLARRHRIDALPLVLQNIVHNPRPMNVLLDELIADEPSDRLANHLESLENVVRQEIPWAGIAPEAGDVLDWDEARSLLKQGFSIGGHTVDHRVLTHEPIERVEEELRSCKQLLETQLGTRVEHFAYCNGWYSDQLIGALVRLGFRSAATTEDLPNAIGGDPFTLRRKVLWENFSIGAMGEYSPSLTACQLDDVFGFLGVRQPVAGRRPTMNEVVV
jgi:peptidoglycan/xylan/chitin deacetylase (PgdA/CDA1 family)